MKQSKGRSKKYRTRVISVTILLAILLLMDFPAFAAKENSARLRIPFPETEGFTMTDENGKRSGLIVDYLYEIAKYTGWSYEFIDTDASSMVRDFIAGQYLSLIHIFYAAKHKGRNCYCIYDDSMDSFLSVLSEEPPYEKGTR